MKFKVFGIEVTIVKTRYSANDALAVELIDADGPFCMLSTNLIAEQLAEGEFAVKNWSENEDVAKAALASGHFIDTGRRTRSCELEAPIWRFA